MIVGLRSRSFPSQKSDAHVERAPLGAAEMEKLGGVDIVIYRRRVLSVRDVVESGAQGEVEAHQSEPPFGVQVERKIAGKAAGIGRFDQSSLLIDDAEWVAASPFNRIRQIDLLHQRRPAP